MVDAGGTDTPMGMTDTPAADVPGLDAPAACVGMDGLPCLTADNMTGVPDFTCDAMQTTGADRMVNFRLVKRGLGSTPIAGSFEVWTNNVLGADCAAAPADCIALTAGACPGASCGIVSGTVPGDWYAYRVPRIAAAMTFDTVGYNRPPSEMGGMDDITTIDATIFSTAIGLIRPGLSRDLADGVITGDVGDCMGDGLNGVTVRLFDSAGMEIMQGTGANDMGLAYRAGGALPDPDLTSTDDSGGYAAANVPLPADFLVNVVAYANLTAGGPRTVIGCEVVSVAMSAVTILSIGPARSDYVAGSFCDMMTP